MKLVKEHEEGRNDATDADIGARLKEAREAAGLTQKQAARLIEMDQEKISLIERGQRSVKATELIRFSDIYSASVDWILGEWGDTDVPQEYIDLMEKLPPPDARKLIRTIAMMGDRYQSTDE